MKPALPVTIMAIVLAIRAAAYGDGALRWRGKCKGAGHGHGAAGLGDEPRLDGDPAHRRADRVLRDRHDVVDARADDTLWRSPPRR